MSRLLFTLWDGGGNVPPVVSLAGALAVNMSVAANAPDSCQADIVSWTAIVQMVTLGN